MNSHLMEILAREAIKSLPDDDREIYEYVVNLEDELAQQAETADEFMALLIEHAPHRQAAEHFSLSFGQLIRRMHQIEDQISEQLELKSRNATWLDITESVAAQTEATVKYFYFSLNEVHS